PGREHVVDMPAFGAGPALVAVAQLDERDRAVDGGELPDRIVVPAEVLRVVTRQPVRRGIVGVPDQLGLALLAAREHRLLLAGRPAPRRRARSLRRSRKGTAASAATRPWPSARRH